LLISLLRLRRPDNPLSGPPRGQTSTVVFGLRAKGTNLGFSGIFGTEDLSQLVLDGDLDIVYHHDAIIHSARLQITGVAVPEPSSLVFCGLGLAALAG
jgi:hypothetical protein